MVRGAVLRVRAVQAVASLVTWWGWLLTGLAAWCAVSLAAGLVVGRMLSGRRR